MARKGVNWFAVFARRNANRHQAQKMRFAMQMASLPEWADFSQYCGRALRARSLRFLIPPIEALKAQRHLAKTSISFAGAGAKTCGLNALAHNLYIARIAQGQNQVLGEFPIHIVFAHGAETKPSPCRRLSLCFCFTLRMARRMYIRLWFRLII